MDVKELKAQHPDVYKAVFDEGKAVGASEQASKMSEDINTAKLAGIDEGKKAERQRIQEIETIKAPSTSAAKVISDNKFKPEMTKEKVAVLVLDEVSKTGATIAGNLAADGNALATQLSGIGTGTAQTQTEVEDSDLIACIVEGGNSARR
jgi:hypothetical protein